MKFSTQQSYSFDLHYTKLFKAIRVPFKNIYFYFTLKIDYIIWKKIDQAVFTRLFHTIWRYTLYIYIYVYIYNSIV